MCNFFFLGHNGLQNLEADFCVVGPVIDFILDLI